MKQGRFTQWLWHIYGYTYDGLLHFYPYTELLRQVVETADVQRTESVLDLGCGSGNIITQVLQLTDSNVVGVDASPSMIAAARRKTKERRVDLTCSDILTFLRHLPDKSFDKVISVNVFYALGSRDQVWKELFRILKPNGRIVVATSVKTGSVPLIRDQIAKKGVIRSLHPQLLGVFLVDLAIDMFGHSGTFAFPNEKMLRAEVEFAGGKMSPAIACYSGVDILFSVEKAR